MMRHPREKDSSYGEGQASDLQQLLYSVAFSWREGSHLLAGDLLRLAASSPFRGRAPGRPGSRTTPPLRQADDDPRACLEGRKEGPAICIDLATPSSRRLSCSSGRKPEKMTTMGRSIVC